MGSQSQTTQTKTTCPLKGREKRKKMQQIAKNMNSLAKEGSEEQVNHYEEYDPYVITVLNQLQPTLKHNEEDKNPKKKKMKNPNEEKKKRSFGGDGADKDGWKRDEKRKIEEADSLKGDKGGKRNKTRMIPLKVGRQREKKSEGIVLTEHEHIVNDFPDRR